eukprot:COSAG01_NODE_7032_length_3383_cov_29.963764_1_plen_711_part_00
MQQRSTVAGQQAADRAPMMQRHGPAAASRASQRVETVVTNPLARPNASVHLADVANVADRAHRWVKRAHRPPELIRSLMTLRSALQGHRAEFDQALELVKAGDEDGASAAARREAAEVRVLLKDIAEETELVAKRHLQAATDEGGPLEPTLRAQQQMQRERLADWTEAGVELFNELGDAYFLTVLWVQARWLFVVSATLLTSNLLGRLWVIRGELRRVDEGKRVAFWTGAALYLGEPSSGLRLMKKALKNRDDGGTHYVAGQGFVTLDQDAVAVAAKNEHVAGHAQVVSTALMAGTGDLPELVVQLIFLVMQGATVGWAFWQAVAGTLIHLAQKGAEARVVHRHLPRLERVAQGRDKTFPVDAVDEDVVAFVENYGGEARRIELRGCKGVTDVGVIKVAEGCPHLTELRLDDTQTTDAGVIKLAEACPHLTYLSFERTQTTDAGVIKVAEACPHLRGLGLDGTQTTDAGVIKVAEGCPHLRVLGLNDTQTTDAGVIKVAEACPHLTALGLNGTQTTDAGVIKVAEGCPHLTELRLRDTQTTDAGVIKVAEACLHLRGLGLDGTQTTDAGVIKVAEACPHLTALGLNGTQTTDAGVIKVAEACPHLTALGLNDTQTTDAGVIKVAEGCSHLTYLSFERTQTTDAGVIKVPEGCPLLTELRLNGTQTTDAGVIKVAKGCSHLTRLRLIGTQTTDAGLMKVAMDYPHITILMA